MYVSKGFKVIIIIDNIIDIFSFSYSGEEKRESCKLFPQEKSLLNFSWRSTFERVVQNYQLNTYQNSNLRRGVRNYVFKLTLSNTYLLWTGNKESKGHR